MNNKPVVLKQTKRLTEAEKQRLTGLNPHSKESILQCLAIYQGLVIDLKRKYRINYSSIELLNVLYFNYHETGMPVSIRGLQKLAKVNAWHLVRTSLHLMEKKGLVIGDSAYTKYKVFSPSVVVIDFYSSLSLQFLPFFAKI